MSVEEEPAIPAAPAPTDGRARIEGVFAPVRTRGRRAALMPYLMGGYPTVAGSLAIGHACIDAGADMLEVGVPYADPLADGPVIHAAGTAALAAGATTEAVLGIAAELARRVPVVLFGYGNLVLARGIDAFAATLAERGASGMIVPDVPLEESSEWRAAFDAHGLALIPLVAPTTRPERMRRICAQARGFVYVVSVTGTTGERAGGSTSAGAVLERARAVTDVPLALGFGISSPADARGAADAGADGVIIGSRLIRAAGEAVAAGSDPAVAVGAITRELAAALAR